VLSGLAQHLPIDSVRGARVLVLCNLAYKKMGGVESQGMVLCAKAAGGGLAFVSPQVSSTPGTRISVDGYPGDPELNPKKMAKKKAWEACMPELATDANGIACYKGIPFRLPEGVCAAEGIANAPIS
jgi:aminoacyl tRNA synthase complex-interacting multifunctional protein 1